MSKFLKIIFFVVTPGSIIIGLSVWLTNKFMGDRAPMRILISKIKELKEKFIQKKEEADFEADYEADEFDWDF
ncbi:MAG: hypothetical protein MJ133_07500 [Lachnospiraceae bacterium]|nr:hypothetical protein [Lachnospiraceae bacterium]